MTFCCLTGEFVAICVYLYVSRLKIYSKIMTLVYLKIFLLPVLYFIFIWFINIFLDVMIISFSPSRIYLFILVSLHPYCSFSSILSSKSFPTIPLCSAHPHPPFLFRRGQAFCRAGVFWVPSDCVASSRAGVISWVVCQDMEPREWDGIVDCWAGLMGQCLTCGY